MERIACHRYSGVSEGNKERRKKVVGKVFAILFAFTLVVNSFAAAPPKVGEKAKDFTLTNLKGEKVTLKDFQGKKAVFLNFFTTWCPSCREEIPILTKLYPEYSKKNIEFISVDLRESQGKVAGFLKKFKINYPMLIDPKGKVGDLYGVPYFPFNLLIDREGIIRFIGSFLSEKELRKELDKVIPSKKEKPKKLGEKS